MASNWRQNVANYGWANSDLELYARLVVAGIITEFAAIKLRSANRWFFVVPDPDPILSGFFFLSGPLTFHEVLQSAVLEPDGM